MPCVPLPRLVFRIGFAGAQKLLPDTAAALGVQLAAIFETIGSTLYQQRSFRFYKPTKPLLRLVTGLCEGADFLAAETLQSFAALPAQAERLETELAAVIPFDLAAYRASRPEDARPLFDEQAARCAYILALDGIHDKPDPDTAPAALRRARAYRAQGAYLLRHADLLLAVAAPDASGKAGGTMETAREAIEFGLPVVFVHAKSAKVTVIDPGDDFASATENLAQGQDDWQKRLGQWMERLTGLPAEPDTGDSSRNAGQALLDEYFHDDAVPPETPANAGKPAKRKISFRGWLWDKLYNRCAPAEPKMPRRGEGLPPYAAWRERGAELNHHYAGNYRGTFLLNYVLAALAVAFAAGSLVLLAFDAEPAEGGVDAGHAAMGLLCALLALGASKFWMVVSIARTTHQANTFLWNDKAVDYRYLAERLRAMYFLPRIGSFQPPAAAPPQHALRALRQNAVDWLVDALVRSVSPKEVPALVKAEAVDLGGRIVQVNLFWVDPLAELKQVRDEWIEKQAIYHERTADTMERIGAGAQRWAKWCNQAVIGFVAIDILCTLAIALGGDAGWLPHDSIDWLKAAAPHWEHGVHVATLGLIFLAALLPAVVASLNGIRFQSECGRLGERSAAMRTILRGRRDARPGTDEEGRIATANRLLELIETETKDPQLNRGSWDAPALRFTESVAEVFVQEVGEWSVLYARELADP